MEVGVRSDRDEGAPTATADARDSGGGSRDADDAVRTGESAAVGAGPRSELQVVRWERFLPRRSLRILVVEHDDSTRHIVMVLLRKCSYNVVAVADGLKAWEVLKEKRYNFDLVLTEVDIPSLSGIGLLSKIMAAEQCKNIPVIMMSSRDSISVVHKCMLNGAVDFLVKPVRKNELRNLWQHVWRRRWSSRSTAASDNIAAINHVSVNSGNGSKTGENSDRGDAQISGSKPEMENKSVQKNMPKAEDPGNGTEIITNQSKNYDDHETRDEASEPKAQVNQSIQEALLLGHKEDKIFLYNTSMSREEELAFLRLKNREDIEPKPYCQPDATTDILQNVINFIEPRASRRCMSAALGKVSFRDDVLCETPTSSHGKSTYEFGSSQLHELSLRRPQINGCVSLEFKEKHVLNHSNASAFSRYGDKKMHHSSQKPVSSLFIHTKESIDKPQLHVSTNSSFNEKSHSSYSKEMVLSDRGKAIEAAIYLDVSSDINKEDGTIFPSHPVRENASVGHSSDGANSFFWQPQSGILSVPVSVGEIPYQSMCAGYHTILQPMFYPETSQPQNLSASEDPGATSCTPLKKSNQTASSNQDIYKVCGKSDCDKTTEAAANAVNSLENWNDIFIQNSGREGLDCDRARREAALIKFRLKRKDRCFEKKVRYHSRKTLAEQRLRIKGQFVRKKATNSATVTQSED
ncbi:two-component response regulator-like APRR9 isoform X2 [Musa acuminata AAA Group]|uniref:two-component response regulator-like APRR9 isoform X2 n=1 Tax=Musa acuminata AAA Group TaxID=214697 RepID=UPI0031E1B353